MTRVQEVVEEFARFVVDDSEVIGAKGVEDGAHRPALKARAQRVVGEVLAGFFQSLRGFDAAIDEFEDKACHNGPIFWIGPATSFIPVFDISGNGGGDVNPPAGLPVMRCIAMRKKSF